MAVTVNTHSKPIGWSRSDVIDQLEEAHTTVGAHMGPVTGLVACLLYTSPSPRD